MSGTAPRPFVAPGRVVAGFAASAALASELSALGVARTAGRVLVTVDATVRELGLADAALDSLARANYEAVVPAGVAAEPTPADVERIAAVDGPVAAVVAIGGGSAIDAAKLVAIELVDDLPLNDGIGPDAELRASPPVIALPTTAGTGAEATAVAMLWSGRAKRVFVHPRLVPRVALLDPDLLLALPPPVTAAGGLDAISHAVESLLSTYRTPLTSAHARLALEALAGALLAAYRDGTPEARLGTLLGSYHAGLALNASVVAGHSIAYAIAARTGLAHGVTCAMALPYCLAHCRSVCAAELDEIAALAGAGDRGDDLLRWIVALNDEMEIPTSLAAVGVGAGDLEGMAREIAENYPRPNSPVPLDAESLRDLLGRFHAGDAETAWRRRSGSPAA